MAITDRRGVSVDATDSPIAGDPNPGLAIKAPARAATTAAITLSGLQTVDGLVLATGDRVLVQNQADATTNGLYNASTGPWTRTIDALSNDQWTQGTQVLVAQGATWSDTVFELVTVGPIVLGTSSFSFANFNIPPTRNVLTTAPIAGGGPLSSDLDLSLTINGSLQVSGGALAVAPLAGVSHKWVSSFNAAGGPQLTQPAVGDISGAAALSASNDTNVTVTLGGGFAAALLSASSITLGWTSTLAAARLNANVVQAITPDTNLTGSISAQVLTLAWNGTLAVARGGTGGGAASGTLLDNITGFSATGFLTRTGAGTYAFQSATNGITNGNLVQAAAATLKGNPTAALANVQDFTIQGLTDIVTPSTTLDWLVIYNHTTGTLQKTNASEIAAAISTGVSSYNTRTGAVVATGTDVPLRSYLHGLMLSTAGSSSSFGISAGVATDSTNVSMMGLATAYTKTTGAWAVGSGNGALDTGAIANTTGYHVYEIQRPDTGVVDIAISLSASAPTTGGNIPAAYTLFRRIGWMRTDGSAHWLLFTQLGDEFLWAVGFNDVGVTNLGTVATLYPLTVPSGVQVVARIRGNMSSAAVADILLNSPDETSTAFSGFGNGTMRNPVAGQNQTFGAVDIRTNISAQIRAVSDTANTTLDIYTYGWRDRRGKDL